jgi:hypothetical protein
LDSYNEEVLSVVKGLQGVQTRLERLLNAGKLPSSIAAECQLLHTCLSRVRQSVLLEGRIAQKPDMDKTLADIEQKLDELGISPTVVGYHYVCKAVLLILRRPDRTRGLYTEIGKIYGIHSEHVRDCIRTAIKAGYAKYPDRWKELLADKEGRPANIPAIMSMARVIRNQYTYKAI